MQFSYSFTKKLDSYFYFASNTLNRKLSLKQVIISLMFNTFIYYFYFLFRLIFKIENLYSIVIHSFIKKKILEFKF